MIKHLTVNGVFYSVKELLSNGYKIGDQVELKKYKPETKIDKVRALWYLLIKELSDTTGYSKLYWKNKFKNKTEFYEICTEPDGTKSKAFKSVADGCSWKDLSQLFTDSISYVEENEIIDLTNFKTSYYEITGRELI